MHDKSSNFLYSFFILFLCILLAMFVMFTIMVNYDRDTAAEESFSPGSSQEGKLSRASEAAYRDLTPLYRANLFAIDLCLIVLTEVSLIVLFVKFTIPAALLATAAMILIMADAADTFRRELIPRFLSRFVSNRYATLSHTDLVLLIILSGLMMAFVVSVLLRQHGMKTSESVQQDSASPPPPSVSSPPAEPSE